MTGIDEIVLSLTARGLTTGEVAAHFAEVYGAKVSKDTISKITDKVVTEMTEWANRPLDRGRLLANAANGLSCCSSFPSSHDLKWALVCEAETWSIVELGCVICSTNAIESLNARYRRAVKTRGHCPTEQAR